KYIEKLPDSLLTQLDTLQFAFTGMQGLSEALPLKNRGNEAKIFKYAQIEIETLWGIGLNKSIFIVLMLLLLLFSGRIFYYSQQFQRPILFNKQAEEAYKSEMKILIEKIEEQTLTIQERFPLTILKLRSEPEEELLWEVVSGMIQAKGFFDIRKNPTGRGISHQYEVKSLEGKKIVIDHTTGLMWQQAGSDDRRTYEKAQEYIEQLNQYNFAGFSDWRLPTLEEAMSLMEAKPNEDNELYINSMFDKERQHIWTADKVSASRAWYVGFGGGCYYGTFGRYYYVRAVRSGH
ncbi:MAG: DUF1566 domain-containing protein, partial [Candidatus Thorarchaeota archaeon]